MKTPIVDFLAEIFNTDQTVSKEQFKGIVKGVLYGLMIFQNSAQDAFVELQQVVAGAKSEDDISKMIDKWTADLIEKQEWGADDIIAPPDTMLWN